MHKECYAFEDARGVLVGVLGNDVLLESVVALVVDDSVGDLVGGFQFGKGAQEVVGLVQRHNSHCADSSGDHVG